MESQKQIHALYEALICDLTLGSPGIPLPDVSRGVFQSIDAYNPHTGTPRQVATAALLKSVAKRYIKDAGECVFDEAARDRKALDGFLEANNRCKLMNESLGNLRWTSSSYEEQYLAMVIEEARIYIEKVLSWTDDNGITTANVPLGDLADHLRCGPGASNGVEGTTFVDKTLTGPLTMTSMELYSWYEWCLSIPSTRHNAVGTREGGPSPSLLACEAMRHNIYGEKVLPGSKLTFVPKSWKTSRTIATEPSLNMMFQLGLHELLSFFLRRAGLDIQNQQALNRRLARIGSEDGSFFTVDLSQASDSVSMKLVELLMPKDWYEWFLRVRSPVVTLPGGKMVELHMMSSMGNGFTFALETLVFLAVTRAVFYLERKDTYLTRRRGSYIRYGNVGVYGDDIIAPNTDPTMFYTLSRVLSGLGFIVNSDKSFHEGPFRESCGGDYYNGHDVRGVFTEGLRTEQDRYSFMNRLIAWGATHGYTFSTVYQLLFGGSRDVLPIPQWEDVASGLRVPYRVAEGILRRRLRFVQRNSRGFDRARARCHQPLAYAKWKAVPEEVRIVDKKGAWRYRWGDPSCVMTAALQGCLKGTVLHPRCSETRYKLAFGLPIGWDTIPGSCGDNQPQLDSVLRAQIATLAGVVMGA